MKKVLVIFLLITTTNATAQTEKAFFARDSASMKNIANMVIENAKNKYTLDKVAPATALHKYGIAMKARPCSR